ncbi:solute carrier family 35 member G1-like [Ptychodera flava]|uniref:solute carrier family 35 member G1-like n=1 Tax=Ptychodera flava TaxID=63121 RepID=UPI00396A01F6
MARPPNSIDMASPLESTWLFKDNDDNPTNGEHTSASRGQSCVRFLKANVGVLLALLSGPIVAVSNLFSKLASEVPPIQQTLLCAVPFFIVAVGLEVWRREQLVYRNVKQTSLLILQGILVAAGTLVNYTAVRYIRLGNFTTITKSILTLTSTVGGAILLGEPCGITLIIGAITNIIGVVLISRPSFLFHSTEEVGETLATTILEKKIVGYVCAVAYGVCLSLAYITVRALGENVSLIAKLLYQGVFLIVLSLIVTFSTEKTVWSMSSDTAGYIVGMSCLSTVGAYFLVTTCHIDFVGAAILLSVLDVVVAFILQAFVNGIEPEPLDYVGAVIIILGCSIITGKIAWDKRKMNDR